MTREDYLLSDLDSLLSKDNITENDLLQLPELLLEDQKNSFSETALTHESEILSITPTDEPTIALNCKAKKRKSTIPSTQIFQKQKKSEEATHRYSFTDNPQFQLNVVYKTKENLKPQRILFCHPKRQEFTIKNSSLYFHTRSVLSDWFQHSIKCVTTLTKEKFDDDQLLSTVLAVEIEDVKKTLA